MKDLSAQKEKLLELLVQDIGDAIKELKEWLPEKAALRREVLGLEGRFREVNKQKLKGIISFENYQLECNRLRDELLNLIQGISPEDFKTDGRVKEQRHKRGSVLYNIPLRMKVDTTCKCQIRIAFDEDLILENIELTEGAKIQDIRISNVMAVDLLDPMGDSPAFSIYTISEKEQFIEEDDFTEWVFYVKPLREGQFPLLLKVSIIELINNKERKRDIVLEEEVLIVSKEEPAPESTEASFRSGNYAFMLAGVTGEQAVVIDSAPSGSNYTIRDVVLSNNRFRTASITLIFLLVVSIGGWAVVPGIQENILWKKALRADNIEQYKRYLEKYPNGKHASAARDSLERRNEELVPVELDTLSPETIVLQDTLEETSEPEEVPPAQPPLTEKPVEETEPEAVDSPITEITTVEPEPSPPPAPQFFTDSRDGSRYQITELAGLTWMMENMRLNPKSRESYCYDLKEQNCAQYGRLYTWDEAFMACPEGWRLPTDQEWRKMAKLFGGCDVDASDGGRSAFQALFGSRANAFRAQAGGERDVKRGFRDLGLVGNYWSKTPYASSNAYFFQFDTRSKRLIRSVAYKKLGFSCRCVKE